MRTQIRLVNIITEAVRNVHLPFVVLQKPNRELDGTKQPDVLKVLLVCWWLELHKFSVSAEQLRGKLTVKRDFRVSIQSGTH